MAKLSRKTRILSAALLGIALCLGASAPAEARIHGGVFIGVGLPGVAAYPAYPYPYYAYPYPYYAPPPVYGVPPQAYAPPPPPPGYGYAPPPYYAPPYAR